VPLLRNIQGQTGADDSGVTRLLSAGRRRFEGL
jgi:hypothetical protein